MTVPPNPGLGTEFRRRRAQLRLTQVELAERAGVGKNTVFRAECGTLPGGPALAALIAALGCEVTLTEPGEIEALRARLAQLEALVAAQREALSWQSLKAVRAENRRLWDVLNALARQEELTHDLIDQARAAASGTPAYERTAA